MRYAMSDMRHPICDCRNTENRISHIGILKINYMHNFKELIVWQKSRYLVKDIYKLTQKFPADERFGLTQQIRRAAVSIPSNIAEGSGRGTNNDFSHFIDIANGSAFELETQMYLALDLEYISQSEFEEIAIKLIDVEKLIYNFKKSLSKN